MIINSIIKERQQPLIADYIKNPELAWVTDMAIIEGKDLDDPLHTSVSINEELKVDFPIGVHRAVGGIMTIQIREIFFVRHWHPVLRAHSG